MDDNKYYGSPMDSVQNTLLNTRRAFNLLQEKLGYDQTEDLDEIAIQQDMLSPFDMSYKDIDGAGDALKYLGGNLLSGAADVGVGALTAAGAMASPAIAAPTLALGGAFSLLSNTGDAIQNKEAFTGERVDELTSDVAGLGVANTALQMVVGKGMGSMMPKVFPKAIDDTLAKNMHSAIVKGAGKEEAEKITAQLAPHLGTQGAKIYTSQLAAQSSLAAANQFTYVASYADTPEQWDQGMDMIMEAAASGLAVSAPFAANTVRSHNKQVAAVNEVGAVRGEAFQSLQQKYAGNQENSQELSRNSEIISKLNDRLDPESPTYNSDPKKLKATEAALREYQSRAKVLEQRAADFQSEYAGVAKPYEYNNFLRQMSEEVDIAHSKKRMADTAYLRDKDLADTKYKRAKYYANKIAEKATQSVLTPLERKFAGNDKMQTILNNLALSKENTAHAQRVNRKHGGDISQLRTRLTTQRNEELRRILSGVDKEELNKVMTHLADDDVSTGKAAELREFLDKVKADYDKATGNKTGSLNEYTPITKDIKKILGEDGLGTEFIEDAVSRRAFKSKYAGLSSAQKEELLAKTDNLDDVLLTAEEKRKIAEDFVKKADALESTGEIDTLDNGTAAADLRKELRNLSDSISSKSRIDSRRALSGWDNDFQTKWSQEFNDVDKIGENMTNALFKYVDEASSKQVSGERFGTNGEKLITDLAEAVTLANKQGVPINAQDVNKVINTFNAYHGRYGYEQGVSEFVSGTKKVASLLSLVNAPIRSFTDVANISITNPHAQSMMANTIMTVMKRFGDGLKAATKNYQGSTRHAEAMLSGATLEAQSSAYIREIQEVGVNQKLDKTLDTFFKASFMSPWSAFVRGMAFDQGKAAVIKDLSLVRGNSFQGEGFKARQRLEYLGIDVNDYLAKQNDKLYSLAATDIPNNQIGVAANNLARMGAITPTFADRPLWHSNRGWVGLAAVFQGYPVMFVNTVLPKVMSGNSAIDMHRSWKGQENGAIATALMVGSTIGIGMAQEVLYDVVKGKERDPMDIAASSIERSNLLGTFGYAGSLIKSITEYGAGGSIAGLAGVDSVAQMTGGLVTGDLSPILLRIPVVSQLLTATQNQDIGNILK